MTIRWGIIGCGDVCEVKSGPPLYTIPGSTVTVVMRRHRDAARDFAERHGIATYTDDAVQLIERQDVDAVYVATPPGSHLDYALAVARAGKPCYVEKPMARTAAECEQMVAAFEAAKLPLFVAYYRRALPRFREIERLVRTGELGEVMAVHYQYQGERRHRDARKPSWREDVAISGGGLFLDLGSHVLDLLDYLFGPLTHVHGRAARRSSLPPLNPGAPEDTVSLTFATEIGVLGSCTFAFHTTRFIDQLTLIGSHATLTASVFGSEPLTLVSNGTARHIPVSHPRHVQYPLIETIVSELSGGGLRCPSTGRSALRTNRVMDEVLTGYYGGRSDAFWERPETWPGLELAG